jgi:hypothetical protein
MVEMVIRVLMVEMVIGVMQEFEAITGGSIKIVGIDGSLENVPKQTRS